MVTSGFLKQILAGEKKLLKASEAKICNPPRYDEISVSNLYAECIELEGMADYFPDDYPKGRSCSREYFFTVLATLYPQYLQDLIKKSKLDRFSVEGEGSKNEAIVISSEWEQQLKEFPQFARKYSETPVSNPICATQDLRAG